MDFNLLAPETLLIMSLISLLFLSLGFLLGFLTKKKVLIAEKEAELKKIIAAERKAKEEAEEAIKARDEFLSVASHELKTPLTTITLRIQSTLDNILNQSLANFSGEKLVSSLTVAYDQTNRLQKLIKDLLNFSLIARGKLDLELKDAPLEEIVRATINRFEDHLNLAGCTLVYKADEGIVGQWDQIRLEQAISNLLTNAIKYGEGSQITVTVKKDGNKAKIIVSDKGIGIDSKQQKQIFERFKRGTKDGKYQGLGVGLFIVKQIVEAHGGEVSVKSKLGSGSTFTIELPIKTVQLALPAPRQEANFVN